MKSKSTVLVTLLIFLLSNAIVPTQGGLLGLLAGVFGGYGACQSACNAGWVTCYAGAGLVAGTVTGGVGAPAAAIVCNAAQGTCMAGCAAAFLFAWKNIAINCVACCSLTSKHNIVWWYDKQVYTLFFWAMNILLLVYVTIEWLCFVLSINNDYIVEFV